MKGMNRVVLMGTLTKSPYKTSGQVRFEMTTREHMGTGNEKQEVFHYHTIVVKGKGMVDRCMKSLKQGSFVLVEGKLISQGQNNTYFIESTEISFISNYGEANTNDNIPDEVA